MKTSPITPADLQRSVLSVPPLARNADLSLNVAENRRLVAHLEAGGVSTLLYGGNANLYHSSAADFAAVLEMLATIGAGATWVIPSIGADFGKLLDQAAQVREHAFPTVMALPMSGLATSAGVATGLRRAADIAGRPLIAYLKSDNYLAPRDLKALLDDGAICAIKYGLIRKDPADDAYLHAIGDTVDPRYIVSGLGEQPTLEHFRRFGLRGFTSGLVCIAPALSMRVLAALRAENYTEADRLRGIFAPLEHLRDRHSPIVTLHDAISLCEVAQMGPIMPLLSNLDDAATRATIQQAARTLLDIELRERSR